MGEASNPGPVHTRQARRLERLGSTQVEPSSDEEILVRPNNGRHVIPRRTSDVPVVASQHNRKLVLTIGTTVGEKRATVPASSQCLIAAADNVQLPGCADREDDVCSSAGSESCWSEREGHR